jgi:hypothetical protein
VRLNETEFTWTGPRRRAVELVAQDLLSDVEIAQELGIGKATLERWKKAPAFVEAVVEATEAAAEALRLEGIANKQNRIDGMVQRAFALQKIIKERGEDPHLSSFPGGSTGYVGADLKLIKVIDETATDDEGNRRTETGYKEFWVHFFDKTIWDAALSIEKQIAQETGQWEEKIDQSVTLQREITIYQGETGQRVEEPS